MNSYVRPWNLNLLSDLDMSLRANTSRFYEHEKNNNTIGTLNKIIEQGLNWLDRYQKLQGYWIGILESNVCIESEWLLAMHFLGIENDPKVDGMVRGILNKQRSDGSWESYYDAPNGDINATVEAYAALRATGLSVDDPVLKKARNWIFAHGGLPKIRVFTRYWLALIGEWPWRETPNIPPEIIFSPRWFPFNIYNFASWSRATLLPLSILCARRPVRPLPKSRRLDELFPEGRLRMDYSLPRKQKASFWERCFLMIDHFLHIYQQIGLTPGRETAIGLCLEWIIKHQDADGSWGGIQPPWIYSLLALHTEGYPLDHPVLYKGLDTLNDHWLYKKDDGLHIQASESPVWDTSLALMAMQDCRRDYQNSVAMQRAVEWILAQQARGPGDWKVKVKKAEPGGWAFERANRFYPDVDDTAVTLLVLARLVRVYENQERLQEAIDRALNWLLAMQSSNGGWAAFDKDNNLAILTKIPFCDFGEALDPPSADVTAHVLEVCGYLGMNIHHPSIRQAIKFIRKEQEPEGCWFGRWGVNYIYGTAAVLPALKAIGEDMNSAYVRKAADWIQSCQNPDGGWGETCESYMDYSMRGIGPSTPSQTAWALMALLAVDPDSYRSNIERGVNFLIQRQKDGTWYEPQYTGTGFPGYIVGKRIELRRKNLEDDLRQGTELSRGFMVKYNLYCHYFPLIALGRAREYLQSHFDK